MCAPPQKKQQEQRLMLAMTAFRNVRSLFSFFRVQRELGRRDLTENNERNQEQEQEKKGRREEEISKIGKRKGKEAGGGGIQELREKGSKCILLARFKFSLDKDFETPPSRWILGLDGTFKYALKLPGVEILYSITL